MKYLSVCSGIEAATVAWAPLGWQAAGFYETDAFCSALLAHYYPGIPNGGDFTLADWSKFRDVELLIAGTPCQDFSVAGHRAGAAGERGRLTLLLGRKIDELENFKIFIWENVPGVLSDRGNVFGDFLALLAGEVPPLQPPGGRWTDAGFALGPQRSVAWRLLDAQYFGLAQRRKRLFLAACPRTGADPRQILFEFQGRRRDFAPGRPAGEESAAASGLGSGSRGGNLEKRETYAAGLCPTLSGGAPFARAGQGRVEDQAFIAHTLRGEGFDASEDGGGRANLIVFAQNQNGNPRVEEVARTLTNTSNERASARNTTFLSERPGVRRLTPRECERLQGFPDDYTLIPWRGRPAERCPDGRRYLALGNSIAVPVLVWLALRITGVLEAAR